MDMNIPKRSEPLVAPVASAIVFPGTMSICLLGLGMLVSSMVYGSIQPVLIGVLFLLPPMFLTGLKGIGSREEQRTYFLVYSVGWFWAGIAAIYADVFHDRGQAYSDAGVLFNLAIGGDDSGMEFITVVSDGGGLLIVWQFFYDLFSDFGLEKGRYIGVTINITLVSLSAVIGVKTMRVVFGEDRVRIRRFALAFSLCGMFWLFAAIHLRDAMVLFGVSLLTYYWIRFMGDLSMGNLFRVGAASLVALATFGFLRTEFVFVPLAMTVGGIASYVFGRKDHGSYRWQVVMICVLILPGTIYLGMTVLGDLVNTLRSGLELYNLKSAGEASSDSLGMKLIINQPMFIRLIVGPIYLWIYPIPVWTGFQLEMAINLFKSLHVLFMYVITPLFMLSIIRIFTSKTHRTMPILFLLILIVGFTLSIAMTSMESRHLGAFMPAILMIAMLPDLTTARDRLAYRNLLGLFLVAMFFVHLAWIVLKLL